MEKILDQPHTKESQFHNRETLLYGLSKMFERAAYYGVRALVVIYMVSGILAMDTTEAISVLGWFSTLLIVSQIIGAVLGDLVIGNRKSIILGGIIQAIGAFILCIPSSIGLYVGLLFIVLGGGLYSPNIISNFGKLYLGKTKLLDSAFAFFYLAINIGSFLGVVAIGYCGEKYSWSIGFIIAGVLMLISVLIIFLSKENVDEKIINNEISTNQRVIDIFFAFLLVAIFWATYELSSLRIFDLQLELSEVSKLNIPKYLWASLQSIFTLPITLIVIVLWTYYYNSHAFKLMLGFAFASISFGILFLIPEIPGDQHTMVYLIALLFLATAEMHIAPILNAVLTKYSNPKYLAIVFSLAFIPSRLFVFILGYFNDTFYGDSLQSLKIALFLMVVISIGLIIFILRKKRTT